MSEPDAKANRYGARPVADLIPALMRPAAKRRGFASVDLVAYWADIVGAAYADCTRPERLTWPKRIEDGGEQAYEPATLTVAVEGSRALLFQHEAADIARRINAVYGFKAVGRIRIVQKPITRIAVEPSPRPRALSPAEEKRLAASLDGIENEGLKAALERLGRGVMGTERRR
ncbi:DUF721 domain-containing protein [Prosthecomicrobium hirschii]|uniref:RNA-binding protein n=1 Tax=Prosthecodimorpha hirschii TaxID=665126 RepID=A0A0P6VJ88_9HYPH|nr:DciA family protein [Prosthecomicrobium hirschii]KPL52400.1 hypothetical protein ABB55_09300 [Prosthecomicrobium hirschii]MCW1843188.1 DciA family protein [Prosthecomicrobium hirschii]TPQ51935.1 DUF721 domain-containing protein [Prosthecomicrobium hirschii]